MTQTLDDRLVEAASASDVRKAVAGALLDSWEAARGRVGRRLEAGTNEIGRASCRERVL